MAVIDSSVNGFSPFLKKVGLKVAKGVLLMICDFDEAEKMTFLKTENVNFLVRQKLSFYFYYLSI